MRTTKRGRMNRVLLAAMMLAAGSGSAQEVTDTAAVGFEGYPEAPAFSVIPRKDGLEFFPCLQCHEFMEPDPKMRELYAPHDIVLKHGQGRFWCGTCHDFNYRDNLVTITREPVDFDDAHLVCGGCHGTRHKDWHFGAHGKREANWQGERRVYSCTHCHNAHDPVIVPRKAMAPPGPRAGLQLPEKEPHEPVKVWDRHSSDDQVETPHE